MRPVRYAVVGAGWISQIALTPCIAQTDNSEITAIVSGSSDVARQLAEFHGVQNAASYDDLDALLAGDIVDAVYVALPSSTRADFAMRAANAGKQVLIKKPLGTTVTEYEAMIAAADAAGVLLMTGYRPHFEPGTVQVLEEIRSGARGRAKLFTSIISFQSETDNHRLGAEHWGGPLQDIGVYCINAARHVFEVEPIEATAMKARGDGDPRFTQVAETITATLRFPGERFAQIITSFSADALDIYSVVGTEGVLTIDPGFRFVADVEFRLRTCGKEMPKLTCAPCDHFGAQAAYFSDCNRTGTTPEAGGREGLADLAIMRAIEQAAETGLPQKLALPPRPAHPSPDTVRIVPRTDRRPLL